MPLEIERRFLVNGLAKNMPKPKRKINIVQGYFETRRASRNYRVRICDGKEAFLTIKIGNGLVRDETESKASLELAELMMEDCRHSLKKERWIINGWEIDIYKPPLNGIITAEKELKSPKEKLPVPNWLLGAVEITDTLTSHDLACLATELMKRGGSARKAVKKILKQRS